MAEVTQEPERKIKLVPDDVRYGFDPIAARKTAEERKARVEAASRSKAPSVPPVRDILDQNIGGITNFSSGETRRK